MACPSCAKQTLGSFIQSFAKVNIRTQSRTRRNTVRRISTTTLRPHQPSKSRRQLSSISTPIEVDDYYVPFDINAVQKSSRHTDGTPLPSGNSLPNPFTPPPVPSSLDIEAIDEQSLLADSSDSIRIEEDAVRQELLSLPRDGHHDTEAVVDQHDSSTPMYHNRDESEALRLRLRTERRLAKKEAQRTVEKQRLQSAKAAIGTGNLRPVSRPATRTGTKVVFPRSSQIQAGPRREKEDWQTLKAAVARKLEGEKWNPRKKLSPDAMDGIRAMHQQDPKHFTTALLAKHFEVSPDSIRRILKSSWQPSAEQEEERRERWQRRGERIWSSLAEQGLRPPQRWREQGIGQELEDLKHHSPFRRAQIRKSREQSGSDKAKRHSSTTGDWMDSVYRRIA